MLSDLRESGSLEQDADCIVFLRRGQYYNIAKDKYNTAIADTMLFDKAKQRNGAPDWVIAACSMYGNVQRPNQLLDRTKSCGSDYITLPLLQTIFSSLW